MGSRVFDGITSYDEYPIRRTKGAYQRITVDNGAISIDHADDTVENTHIHLKGDLVSTHSFIKIDSAGGNTLYRIGHNGKVHADSGITAPEISSNMSNIGINTGDISTITSVVTSNGTDITTLQAYRVTDSEALVDLMAEDITTKGRVSVLEAHQTSVESILGDSTAATSGATIGSLVKRGNPTEFDNLQTNVLNVGHSIVMYGDTNMVWQPQETVGGATQNVPGSYTRVGRNQYVDEGPVKDGLEIVGRADETQIHAERNHTLLTASFTEPNILLTGNKTNSAPYIRCKNSYGDNVLELSDAGISMRLPTPTAYHVTPGEPKSVPEIPSGIHRIQLFLVANWDNESDDVVIVLEREGTDEDYKFLAAEISIDQSLVEVGYIDSGVYIDRITKNVRGGTTVIRITIKMELLNDEGSIPANTMLNLTTWNHVLIN